MICKELLPLYVPLNTINRFSTLPWRLFLTWVHQTIQTSGHSLKHKEYHDDMVLLEKSLFKTATNLQWGRGFKWNAVTAQAVPLPTFCEQLRLLSSVTEALPCIGLSSEHLHFLYHFRLKSHRKKINNGTNILGGFFSLQNVQHMIKHAN